MIQLTGSHLGSSTTESSDEPLVAIPLIEILPEVENFDVQLKKDSQGLGITIAGYVCERGMKIKA